MKRQSAELSGLRGGAERLILVDELDNEVGSASREECHRGGGLRHRAFVVLIANDRSEWLLQLRCGRKLGGDRWDVSATSHVRMGETYDSAIRRCVRHELGIVRPIAWRRVLSYTYVERLGDAAENEYCVLYTGRYDGTIHPNHAEISKLRWIPHADLVAEIRSNPAPYTSWLREAVLRFTGLHANGSNT